MTLEEKKSYALGVAIGSNYVSTEMKISKESFSKGFADIIDQKKLDIEPQEIQELLNEIQKDLESQNNTIVEAQKEKGRAFLAENKKKEGIVETQSGLQYEIVQQGNGQKPSATSIVEVHYHGTLLDGTVFDSSVVRGESIEFPLNHVIAGWTEGLQLMNEGSKFIFYIPSHLAYGDKGAGNDIKGGETLIFEVELIKVRQ